MSRSGASRHASIELVRKVVVFGTVGAVVFGVLATTACRRGEPPAAGVDAAVAPLPPPGAGAGRTADAGVGFPTAAEPAAPSALPAPAPSAVVDAGPDPATLPQTRDKPTASGAAFDARVKALWDGIVADDVERAMPFFFPLGAYEQVKAASNPAADWRRRLVAAYKRDVHTYHERLGDKASEAKLVRIDVPDERAKWVEPGDEYNKLGYYRVYGTRLRYARGSRELAFDVKSLISWRGEWYVVHLSSFK